MMPKGVEHAKKDKAEAPPPNVKIPMMPKGVEHDAHGELVLACQSVKIPMMPKGVEHESLQGTLDNLKVSEDSNDAERR